MFRICIFILCVLCWQSPCLAQTKQSLCHVSSCVSIKVSPDGKRLAKVGADAAGSFNIYIQDVENQGPWKQVSAFKSSEIEQLFWLSDSRTLLGFTEDLSRGEGHLFSLDVETGALYLHMEDRKEAHVKIFKASGHERKALIGLNDRNPPFYDLYLLDLETSEESLVYTNDTYSQFLVGPDLERILSVEIDPSGKWSAYVESGELFFSLGQEDALMVELLSYSKENKTVYFLDTRFSQVQQLREKSVEGDREERCLSPSVDNDIDEVFSLHGVPKACAFYDTQKSWQALDPFWQKPLEALYERLGFNFEILSSCSKGQKLSIRTATPSEGPIFWLFDAETFDLRRLDATIDPRNEPLHEMYELTCMARDGLRLVGYYTLPREVDQNGTVEAPIPFVVVPHGGPFKMRDRYEYNPTHQWLASCGYGVLSVNFRLSSGFGKAFVTAGHGQWGKAAHFDVIDAAEACIEKGLAQRGKLAILGRSYGGYESLAALSFSPSYFSCCVAICGPSNLKTVLESVPEFWEFPAKPLSEERVFYTKRDFIVSMGADPKDPQGAHFLESCSPLNFLSQVKEPLLLMHGTNDPIVAEVESRQIYERLKSLGLPVTYIAFDKEGHSFKRRANQLFALDQAEVFLSKYLKGRYVPAQEKDLIGITAEAL